MFFLPISDRDNRFPHRSQIQFDAKESDPTSDALDQLSAEMDRVLQRRYAVWFYKKLTSYLLFYKKKTYFFSYKKLIHFCLFNLIRKIKEH